MAGTVRIQREDGTWETLGTGQARGLTPEGMRPTANSWGSDKLSFDLKRDPGIPWPDLRALTPVEYEVEGQLVWSGRVTDTPMMEGADRKVTVNCDGWQYHLDDQPYRRLYASIDFGNWKDIRESNMDPARLDYSAQVGVQEGKLMIGYPASSVNTQTNLAGMYFDAGPDPQHWIQRASFEWTNKNVSGGWSLNFYFTDDPQALISGVASQYQMVAGATWSTLSSPLAGTATRPFRYFVVYFVYTGTTGTTTVDYQAAFSRANLYGAGNYESHGVSAVTADAVMKDALSKSAPEITLDAEVTAPYPDAIKAVAGLKGYWRGGPDYELADAKGLGTLKPASNTGSGVSWYTSYPTPVPPVAGDPREPDAGGIDIVPSGTNSIGLINTEAHGMTNTDFWMEMVFQYQVAATASVQWLATLGRPNATSNGTGLFIDTTHRLFVNRQGIANDNTGINLAVGETYYIFFGKMTSAGYSIRIFRKSQTPDGTTGLWTWTASYEGPGAPGAFTNRVTLGAPGDVANPPVWMTVDEFSYGTGRANETVLLERRVLPKMKPQYIGNFHQTSFVIPELNFGEASTARDAISGVNAFHNYILKVTPEKRLQFKPRPADPAFVIGAWGGSEFTDASANSAEEIINLAQGEAQDAAGVQLLSSKTSGAVRTPLWDDPSDVNQPRALSGTFDAAGPSDLWWLDADNAASLGQTWTGLIAASSAQASTGSHSGALTTNASGALLIGLPPSGWTWSDETTVGKKWVAGLGYRLYFDFYRPSTVTAFGAGFMFEMMQNGVILGSKFVSYDQININAWNRGQFLDWTPSQPMMSYQQSISTNHDSQPWLRVRAVGTSGNPSTTLGYIDNVRMYRAMTTAPDKRGYVKSRAVAVSSASTQAALDQITTAYMENHKTTPLKGSVAITGPTGARNPYSGRGIHPAHLLLYPNENVRLTHRIDPDTGALGRDGVVASVSYDDSAGTASIEIDATNKNFESMLERYQLIVGANAAA